MAVQYERLARLGDAVATTERRYKFQKNGNQRSLWLDLHIKEAMKLYMHPIRAFAVARVDGGRR